MAVKLPSESMHGRRAPMAEINVTPLVDVMLVLLIIFMVTAPLLTTGVPIELPESRAAALEQEQEPTQISIEPNGQIYIDDAPISDIELAPALAAIASRNTAPEGPSVFLRGDRALDYGRVMLVMGELNRAGINRISLVTTPASEAADAPSDSDDSAEEEG